MNTQLISSYRLVSRWLCGFVLAIGLLVLVGWLFEIPALTSILPGLATMKANSALAFVLAGISLWQVTGEYRDQRSKLIAKVCATITMLIGLFTLGEYVFDRDFGIDQLFFQDTTAASETSFPGRMSPATALNLLLLGSALFLIDNRWSNWLNEALTITALMIAGVAVVGYIYGVSSLYQIGLYASMALHTAVTFILLCLGILSARPEHGLISILSTEGVAGILARRLLPAAVGLPIVLGWLILRGQRIGQYDTAFGIALFALLNVIIFSGLIRWNADMLHRAEVERTQARNDLLDNEKRYRRFFENMHEIFVIQEIIMDNDGKPVDLRFLDLNPAAERILGKPRSELVGRTRSEIAGRPDPEGVEMASRVASTGMPIHMVRSSPGFGRSFESFTYSLGSRIVATLSLDITERKKAEDALRESEANKSSIVESALDCIITIDHQGRILEFNPAAEATFGYTRAEVLGKEMAELIIPPPLREQHRRGLAHFLSTGEGPVLGKRIEINAMRADGTEFPVELAITPIKGEDPPVFTGFLRDITKGKRAELAVSASEERFHLIVEAAPSAMIVVDRDGKIDLVNAKAQELFGYRKEELLERPVEMLVPERFRGRHANYRQSFLVQPISRPMGAGRDLFGLHKDGHEVPIEIGLTPYESSEGPFTLALIVDITERKEAEKALERMNEELEIQVQERTAALSQANALLQMLLDHMPDQIYFKDAQSRFIRNSRSQAKALGLSDPAEVVGKSDFDFFPHAQESFDKEQEIIRSGKPLVDNEERVVWPDGRETWVSTTKMPLLDQAGQIIGTFGISRDITDRKRSELALQKAKLELEAANKELEAFSYSVSHDLRAPLRSVDGFSQALLEDYGEMLPPDGRNFLERIRSSAQRMAELIDDLLNLSKVTRASMKLVPVDLSQLAQGIVAELQRTHPERKVNINITANLKARGDPGLLRAVLENLLNNAWKFTSKQEQAEIEFGSQLENGETIYFIRDNGAGFDMAYVGKLFGAFQRLHAMTEYSGTGIGLATVQRIINRHGGRIWAEGAVDQGATFFFTLPALERARPQPEPTKMDSLDRRVREII